MKLLNWTLTEKGRETIPERVKAELKAFYERYKDRLESGILDYELVYFLTIGDETVRKVIVEGWKGTDLSYSQFVALCMLYLKEVGKGVKIYLSS